MSGGWRVAVASVRGPTHVRRSAPNQDATSHRRIGADPAVEVLAISDGHGGDRYVRSHVGSRFAVEVALDEIEAWWGEVALLGDEQLLVAFRGTLSSRLVAVWRARVQADLDAAPLSPTESEAVGPGDPTVAYGATLLVVAASADRVLLAQLGDGDIVLVDRVGVSSQPVPHDDRLVAGATTSICLETAADDFRVIVRSGDACPQLVVAGTDGYGNSFADPDWSDRVGRDIRQRCALDGLDRVAADLPGWIAESADASGDDVTVGILWRSADHRPAGDGPSATALVTEKTVTAERPSAASSPPIPAPSARFGRPATALLVLIAVLALGVAIAGGYLLGAAGGDDVPTAAPPATPAPSLDEEANGNRPIGIERSAITVARDTEVRFVPDVEIAQPTLNTRTDPSPAVVTIGLVDPIGEVAWQVDNSSGFRRDGQIFGLVDPANGTSYTFRARAMQFAGDHVWVVALGEDNMPATLISISVVQHHDIRFHPIERADAGAIGAEGGHHRAPSGLDTTPTTDGPFPDADDPKSGLGRDG